MTAATMLSAAREAAGVSQRELAARSSMVQAAVSFIETGERNPTAETLERLLAGARHRLVSVPTVRIDSSACAERIRLSLARHRPGSALRALIDLADALTIEEPATRVALCVARPRATGSAFWDAALAAVVHYRLGRAALPVPSWVDEPARTLPEPRTADVGVAGLPVDRRLVAPEFLERNVLIEERTFASV